MLFRSKKIWNVLNWNVDHKCETVEKLNEHIKSGSIKDLIIGAEKEYYEDVSKAAQKIIERKDEVRLVIIAGPSSSGKTTTTIKLAEHLKKEGLKLIALNIDNYFFNLECQPKDEFGDFDFETPEALDLKLINHHLRDLLDYKPVQIPRYSFKTGKRLQETDTFQINKDEIILIDTLHGLYEPMTHSIPPNAKFKLYIETLSQLKDKNNQFTRWTDIRLLRRMVRDSQYRGASPEATILRWPSVRRGEISNIFPFQENADIMFNSALIYELPLLKYFAEPLLRRIPANSPASTESMRLLKFLSYIVELQPSEMTNIPPTSVMREFIGGSSFIY